MSSRNVGKKLFSLERSSRLLREGSMKSQCLRVLENRLLRGLFGSRRVIRVKGMVNIVW